MVNPLSLQQPIIHWNETMGRDCLSSWWGQERVVWVVTSVQIFVCCGAFLREKVHYQIPKGSPTRALKSPKDEEHHNLT